MTKSPVDGRELSPHVFRNGHVLQGEQLKAETSADL